MNFIDEWILIDKLNVKMYVLSMLVAWFLVSDRNEVSYIAAIGVVPFV